MSTLRLALAQARTQWHQPEANRAHLEEMLWQLQAPVDVVLLPEMFTTGFSMDTRQAEPPGLHSLRWMQQVASQTQALVVGSLMIRDQDKHYNRLYAVRPDGAFQQYDKRHLYRMGQENDHYTAGTERLVVEWRGWRICPLVCYDIRFPVWSRNREPATGQPAYDLLCYVASWPATRQHIWTTLGQARAIENQAYVAALSRTGHEGEGLPSNGHSQVVRYDGQPLASAGEDEVMLTAELSLDDMQRFRADFPAYLDGDDFRITGL